MVSPKFKFWSILREESPESQQIHALGNSWLQPQLCSNNNFNPGFNHKRKKITILEGFCFKYEPLFHPLQSPLVVNGKVAQRKHST